ncbi:variable surface protein [Plasmodium gonderi]|uniref:Variable surface protein n=1 Tax=Plasmodium gonderi TaxID=77519 RepID=A0A1Y1JSI1_PLAGO|nr:variable surface protein [Plasmodium gonderi]GAW84415.1 variable surface protein [Plasmodium gonderi]
MTPAIINQTYINWKDYILYREIFESLPTLSQNSEDIDCFINQCSVQVENEERDNFINICQNIRKLFKIMSSNDSCNNRKFCIYINYNIREQIRDLFPTKQKVIFEHFMNYVESNKTDESYNTCVPEIKYIEKPVFDKMNDLYNLYEHYETILYPNSEDNNYSIDCDDINGFIDDYNEIIEKYKHDKAFQKVLNNLRCSIEYNDLFKNNRKCNITEILKNKYNPWDKNECNESEEKEYLMKYSNPNYSYFSTTTYIQPVNMNIIISTTLSSVFLGTVLYYIYKFTTSRNYLRNRFPRMRRMNRNIKDEIYQHEMCNRKHYHRDLKEKYYKVSYDSEREY